MSYIYGKNLTGTRPAPGLLDAGGDIGTELDIHQARRPPRPGNPVPAQPADAGRLVPTMTPLAGCYLVAAQRDCCDLTARSTQ